MSSRPFRFGVGLVEPSPSGRRPDAGIPGPGGGRVVGSSYV